MVMNKDDSRMPNKVLPATVTGITFIDFWPYDDGSPWWAGGISPQPYTWEIEIGIDKQDHSSNLTREPFEYNGLDVVVGDWIASISEPIRALKIIEVIQKTETTVTALVEDEYRYNTFVDPTTTGRGIFLTGGAIIFTTNADGMPLIDPLPNIVNIFSFDSGINGRFRKFDLEHRYKFMQIGHTFVPGDIIAVENINGFVLASSDNSARSVGRVLEAGPGPNDFSVTSFNQLVDIRQYNLVAAPGDFLYANDSDPGNYTTVSIGAPLLLYVSSPVPTTSSGSVSDPAVTAGFDLGINGVSVVFGGTTLTSVVSDINALTDDHRIVATPILPPTTAITDTNDAFYGAVFTGTVTPGTATINGTLVTFDDDTASPGNFGQAADVANDINQAGITDIAASEFGGLVTITEITGGSITIVNVSNDNYGNPMAGPGSATGLPLFTAANTSSVIHLEDKSGGGIILKDEFGTPRVQLGLLSTDNGRPAIGTSVSGGVRQATTTVVPTLTARGLLSPAVGDQAYVTDTDDGSGNSAGEWSLWLWDGGAWIKVSDEDSAATDAQSIESAFSYVNSGVNTIITLSNGRRVISATVEVLTVFDDLTATLSIGDSADDSSLMSAELVDLGSVGTYNAISNFVYSSGSDEDILVTITPELSTQGNVKIVISYV